MEIKSTAAKIQDNLQELFKAQTIAGDNYIRFQLNQEITALFQMEQVEESLIVDAEQITPLPGMPSTTIGMMSTRDRVFCLFDLAQILKLPSTLVAPRQYQVIVVRLQAENSPYIGLAVNRLLGMNRLTQEDISSSVDRFSSDLHDFLVGTTQGGEAIPILNLPHVIDSLKNQNQLFK